MKKIYILITILFCFTTNAQTEEERFSKLLEKATDGISSSQLNLAILYYYGKGKLPTDYKRSFYWIKKSAEKGNHTAQSILAEHYTKGLGTYKNSEKALFWTKKSKENKNEDPEEETEFKLLLENATGGKSESQLNLSIFYYYGKGKLPVDFKRSFYWVKKSAEQGNTIAQNILGEHYSEGIGTLKDPKKAFFWIEKSAEQGNAKAQCNLGVFSAKGIGVLKDIDKAFYWYEKSAKNGNANGQYHLGVSYYNGDGVIINKKKGAHWIKNSFDNGDFEAKLFWDKNELHKLIDKQYQ